MHKYLIVERGRFPIKTVHSDVIKRNMGGGQSFPCVELLGWII